MVSKPEYFVHLLFYLTFEQQWKNNNRKRKLAKLSKSVYCKQN